MVKLEEVVESLIAHKLITSTTGSVSDRAKRRMEKAGREAYEILKKRKSKTVDIKEMKVGLRWSDDQAAWARNLNLALEEFRQEYPKIGEKLDKIIAKHRSSRRAYIDFGGEIPEEIYINIICELVKGTTSREAKQVYNSILIMEKGLRGKERGPNYLILPE